jgi:hypothetical protein
MKLLILVLLVSGTAWATEQDHSCQGGFNCNEGDNGQTEQSQSQAQEQTLAPIITAEGGEATAGDSSAISGDAVVTVLTEGQKYRNSPTVFAPSSVPTSPCRVAASGGVSLLGGAIAAGGSKEDKECTLRETARMFGDLGEINFALSLLCSSLAVERQGLFESCPQVSTAYRDHSPLDILVGAVPEEQPEHEIILELQQQQMEQQQQIQQQQQQYVQALEQRLNEEESKRARKEEEDEGVRQLLLDLYGKETPDE